MNIVVYLIMKKSKYHTLSLFKKIYYILANCNKEDIFIGFTTNEIIAKTYVQTNYHDNLYIKEIIKSDHEYDIFSTTNNLNEIKCYKLENSEDLLIIPEKEKRSYCIKGVEFL